MFTWCVCACVAGLSRFVIAFLVCKNTASAPNFSGPLYEKDIVSKNRVCSPEYCVKITVSACRIQGMIYKNVWASVCIAYSFWHLRAAATLTQFARCRKLGRCRCRHSSLEPHSI